MGTDLTFVLVFDQKAVILTHGTWALSRERPNPMMDPNPWRSQSTTERFGAHLIERGFATSEQVLAALDLQRARQTFFGRVAHTNRMLTITEIFSILNWQADHGGKFGEVGVKLGYLTAAQVDIILQIQLESRPPLGEILVEMGVLDHATLSSVLEQFRL